MTGCPEQFEKCIKKHLNLPKSLSKALNAFGPALKVEKKVSSAFKELFRGGPI